MIIFPLIIAVFMGAMCGLTIAAKMNKQTINIWDKLWLPLTLAWIIFVAIVYK